MDAIRLRDGVLLLADMARSPVATRAFTALLALGGALIVISASARVVAYIGAGGAGQIAQDALIVVSGWVEGEPFAERVRHNVAPSHIQSALIALDIYLGPSPMWTAGFSYLGLTIAFAALFWSLRVFASTQRALAALLVLAMFWLSDANSPQYYGYYWRLAEVSGQMLCVAAGAILAVRWGRGRPLDAVALALIAAAFVFSHVHKGFGFLLGLLLVGLIAAGGRRERVAYGGLLVIYLIYAWFIEGGLARLFDQAGRGGAGGLDQFHEMVAALALLVTAPVRDSFAWAPEPVSAFARALALAGVVWAGLDALKRFLLTREAASGFVVFLMGGAGGLAFLSVVGRFPVMGYEVAAVPRFWSDGLLVLFAALFHATARAPALGFWPFFTVAALAGTHLQAASTTPTFFRAKYMHEAQAAQYAIATANAPAQGIGPLAPRHASALLTIIPLLEREAAAGFGAPGWLASDAVPPDSLPPCPGRLRVTEDLRSAFELVQLQYQADGPRPAFARVWPETEAKPAYGPAMTFGDRRLVSVYRPSEADGGLLVVYAHDQTAGGARAICRIFIDD